MSGWINHEMACQTPAKARRLNVVDGASSGWGVYVVLLIATVLFVAPFYWLVVSAVSTQAQIFSLPPRLLPLHPVWENFQNAFHQTPLLRAFVNSLVIAAAHVALALLLCSLAGYAFAKFPQAPGNRLLFAVVLATMLIPGAVTMIPVFVILARMHLVNTYWAMVLPGAANAFGIFWMRQYIAANVPDDLMAAARIDGCSEWGVYCSIVLPVIRPAAGAAGHSAAHRWLEYSDVGVHRSPYGRRGHAGAAELSASGGNAHAVWHAHGLRPARDGAAGGGVSLLPALVHRRHDGGGGEELRGANK